jgi:hypothetical protein
VHPLKNLISRIQKIIPLLFVDGHFQFFHYLEHVFPHDAFLAHGLIAQQIGRMIRGHERCATVRLPIAAQLSDADGFAQQAFHGRGPECDEYFWPDQINLLVQIGNARFHLLRFRFTVAGRLTGRIGAAFQNIGNVDIGAGKSGGLDDFRQQLTGLAHKRFALLIFIRSRGFAHKHQLRVNAADAEDNIFPR